MLVRKSSKGQRGTLGADLTAVKMNKCILLRPVAVAPLRFLEWTPTVHLRHASLIAIREDKRIADSLLLVRRWRLR